MPGVLAPAAASRWLLLSLLLSTAVPAVAQQGRIREAASSGRLLQRGHTGREGGNIVPAERGIKRPRRVLSKGRMEAFSDGVLAIAITLLVLDIAVHPPGTPLEQVLHNSR